MSDTPRRGAGASYWPLLLTLCIFIRTCTRTHALAPPTPPHPDAPRPTPTTAPRRTREEGTSLPSSVHAPAVAAYLDMGLTDFAVAWLCSSVGPLIEHVPPAYVYTDVMQACIKQLRYGRGSSESQGAQGHGLEMEGEDEEERVWESVIVLMEDMGRRGGFARVQCHLRSYHPRSVQ